MLPLICSMLPEPESREAINLNKKTVLQKNAQNKSELYVRIAKVLLSVAEETANAILDVRYKDFDPLVKNFGCQINAVEISEICGRSYDDLCQEALRVKQYVEQKMKELEIRKFSGKLPQLNGVKTLGEYLITQVKLDMPITASMARLMRMRLLCIINTNVNKGGVEVPQTRVQLLCKKLKEEESLNTPPSIKPSLQCIVDGLQAEESRFAAGYIRQRAERMPDPIRRDLVMRALSCERKSDDSIQTAIVSLPLMHNTEAAIASYNGIICVKNKLLFCSEPIIGAQEKKVFVRMRPEQHLVNVRNIPEHEPLIVIEGYVDNQTNLAGRIMELGLMNIIRANCALIPQFASGACQDPIEIEEVNLDVERYKSAQYNQYRSREVTLEIDHVYCASMGEEK